MDKTVAYKESCRPVLNCNLDVFCMWTGRWLVSLLLVRDVLEMCFVLHVCTVMYWAGTCFQGPSHCGWGVRRKEGKRNRYSMSRKSKMLKVGKNKRKVGDMAADPLLGPVIIRELLSLPLAPNVCASVKWYLWDNSIIFYKDSVICISHLDYITYLHTNPT